MLLGLALVIVALVMMQDSALKDEVKPPQTRDPLKPKLAFMFLARHVMPLDILWQHFFEGSGGHEFNIYIHARHGYSYTKKNTKCQFFVNRQLKNTIQVVWGEASMIQAERLLLIEALKDPLNERFFLLSDSCIPLYNFDYVYNYVISSQKSFVDSFVDYGDEQYNIKMESVIPRDYWRKGSQWFVLTRKHAEAVVADTTVLPVFVDNCQKVVLPDNWEDDPKNNATTKPHNCIPDEHYIQTLFAMKDLEDETERRTLTYSRWENQAKDQGREGWHPVTYAFADATLEAMKKIQDLRSIRYETESRTEWCKAGGEARPCFLFARKFTRAAGFRLLDRVSSYEKAATWS